MSRPNGGVINTIGKSAAVTPSSSLATCSPPPASFAGALGFAVLNAIGAIGSYLFIVGEIKRLGLQLV